MIGTEPGIFMDLTVILICTAIFTVSSGLGLSSGIKRLSNFATLVTLSIVIYILVVGPTKFIRPK